MRKVHKNDSVYIFDVVYSWSDGFNTVSGHWLPSHQRICPPSEQVITIAIIGDSYAAGEGNPDVEANVRPSTAIDRFPEWDDQTCHRSRHSGFTRAVEALDALQGLRVIYGNFACSGATINQGLLGGYEGVSPLANVENLPPQIDQVRQWMNETGMERLDALVISIGANDILFGEAVRACLHPFPSPPCNENDDINSLIRNGLPGQVNDMLVFPGLMRLPAEYDNLAVKVAETLNPRVVLITEYFNPLQTNRVMFCDDYFDEFAITPLSLEHLDDVRPVVGAMDRLRAGTSIANITGEENAWAVSEIIEPLNQEIRSAVQRHSDEHNWVLVDGMPALSIKHGYCTSDERWVNTLRDSYFRQADYKGTAHPNLKGHEALKHLIVAKLVPSLNLPLAPPTSLLNVEVLHRTADGRFVDNSFADPDSWEGVSLTLQVLDARATPKRLVIEFYPSALELSDVNVSFSLNRPHLIAMDEPGVTYRTATRDTTVTSHPVYVVDIPEADTLVDCDWFHYRISTTMQLPDRPASRITYLGSTEVFQVLGSDQYSTFDCPPVP